MKKIKYLLLILMLFLWQFIGVSKFILPTPLDIINTYFKDFNVIIKHFSFTFIEAFLGLSLGTIFGVILAVIMDIYDRVYDIIYPIALITQTVPIIAIAPILIIYFGFLITPKIILVFITSFFPVLISLLEGFKKIPKDYYNLFNNMESSKLNLYRYLKLPYCYTNFVSGFKVSLSYSIISAVIAEWLGGFYGLGVYMTRAIKSYELSKIFAAIFFISLINIIIMKISNKLLNKENLWKKYY